MAQQAPGDSTLLEDRPATKLCARCREIQLWSPSLTFSDYPSSLAYNAGTCDLCCLLSMALEVLTPRTSGTAHFERSNTYLITTARRGRPVASLFTNPPPSLPHLQPGFPLLSPPNSPAHIRVLREWIRSCDETHSCGTLDRTFLPTRVIEVGREDSDDCRLVCAARGQTNPGRYLALSHRWGSSDQHRKFRTLTENIETFKRGIKLKELPKTFLDAVKITRSLGIDYLWIDSLCIVQDDHQDWEMESRLMERVYSSAYLTLAASCANDTHDGFLKPRPWRHCIRMKSKRGPLYYVCNSIDDFGPDVDQGELNQRAWVLQERVLSRRTIYFTEKQTYWECGEGVKCETMTKMTNPKASFLGDSDFPQSIDSERKGKKIQLFQGLYEKYSELALTSKDDRPIAIRGIETRLIRTLKTTGGYGVLSLFLFRCLLWQRSRQYLRRIEFKRGSHVPTWSWMAYEGGIRYMDVPHNRVIWENDIASPFEHRYPQNNKAQDDSELPREIEAPSWELSAALDLKVKLDDPDQIFDKPLKCIILARAKDSEDEKQQLCYVLLISDVSDGGGADVYERVGAGKLRGDQIDFSKGSRNIILR